MLSDLFIFLFGCLFGGGIVAWILFEWVTNGIVNAGLDDDADEDIS